MSRGVQQASAGVAGAVVGVEQRDLVVAVAGDRVQAVEREQIGVFERVQRIAQAAGGGGNGQIGGAMTGRLGFGAGGEQQMGLAGAGRAADEDAACRVLAARLRAQLRQRARGRGGEGLEALIGRKAQRQRQLRDGARRYGHAHAWSVGPGRAASSDADGTGSGGFAAALAPR